MYIENTNQSSLTPVNKWKRKKGPKNGQTRFMLYFQTFNGLRQGLIANVLKTKSDTQLVEPLADTI